VLRTEANGAVALEIANLQIFDNKDPFAKGDKVKEN
jgi:hypothetical protein